MPPRFAAPGGAGSISNYVRRPLSALAPPCPDASLGEAPSLPRRERSRAEATRGHCTLFDRRQGRGDLALPLTPPRYGAVDGERLDEDRWRDGETRAQLCGATRAYRPSAGGWRRVAAQWIGAPGHAPPGHATSADQSCQSRTLEFDRVTRCDEKKRAGAVREKNESIGQAHPPGRYAMACRLQQHVPGRASCRSRGGVVLYRGR